MCHPGACLSANTENQHMNYTTNSCGDVISHYIASSGFLFFVDTCFFALKDELQGRATSPGVRFFTRYLPEFRKSGKKVRVHTKFWKEIMKHRHLPDMQAALDFIHENGDVFETFSASYPDEDKINLDEILRRCTVESKGKTVILTGDHNLAETMLQEKNCEDVLFAPKAGKLSKVMRWNDYAPARLKHQLEKYDIVITSSAVRHKGHARLLQTIDSLNQQGNTLQPIYTSQAQALLSSGGTATKEQQEEELIELNTRYLSRRMGRQLIIVTGWGHKAFQNKIRAAIEGIKETLHLSGRDRVLLDCLTLHGTILSIRRRPDKKKLSTEANQTPCLPPLQTNPFTQLIEQWAAQIATLNDTSIMETLQQFTLPDILGILAARLQDGIGFNKDTQRAEELRNSATAI